MARDIYKVDLTKKDFSLSAQLMMYAPVRAVWDKYKVNKLHAARLIQYSLIMSDLSSDNTYRNVPIKGGIRASRVTYDLFGKPEKTTNSVEVNKLIEFFKGHYLEYTLVKRVKSLASGVNKLRAYIDTYDTSMNDISGNKEFALMLGIVDKNEGLLLEAEKLLDSFLNNKFDEGNNELKSASKSLFSF